VAAFSTRPIRISRFYKIYWSVYGLAHLLFILVLGPIKALATDEDLYLTYFTEIYKNDYNESFLTIGWPNTNRYVLSLFYLPAKVLNLSGVSPLISIRLGSTLIAGLAIGLCVLIAKQLKTDNKYFRIMLLIFTFTPTMFVWSSLGLRESYIYFWTSLMFYSFINYIRLGTRSSLLVLGLSGFGLINTKPYLFIIFAFAYAVIVLFSSALKKQKKLLVILALMSPLLLNPGSYVDLIPQATNAFKKVSAVSPTNDLSPSKTDGQESESPQSSNTESHELENQITRGQTTTLLINQIEGSQTLKNIFKRIGLLELLESENRRSIGKLNSQQAIEDQQALSLNSASLTKPLSLITASFRFLIYPNPARNNGSFILNLLAFEILLWLVIYSYLGCYLLKRFSREEKLIQLGSSILVFSVLLFIAMSALMEVNVGTALRHRSIVAIVALLLSTLGTPRNWVFRKIKILN
jgi:hypothetical protein